MTTPPRITSSGAGAGREAAAVARSLEAGVAAGLAQQRQPLRQPLRIDSLRLRLPAGASEAEIARAVARAVAAHRRPR